MSTTDDVVRLYIHDVRERFGWVRRLAERALGQLTDEEFMAPPKGGAGNGVAVQIKHLAGFHLSRWTDFLTSDGEKPDRNRDGEFVLDGDSREELMSQWDAGWRRVLDSLEGLTHADLARTVTVRGEPMSVPAAINRSLIHASYHVGQIVQLAREHRGEDWETLSIPPGGSEEHTRRMMERFGSGPER